MAQWNDKGRNQHRAHTSKLAFDWNHTVWHQRDSCQHRRQQHSGDGCDRGHTAELREQQARPDGAACDAHEVGDAVVTGRVTALLRRDDVR